MSKKTEERTPTAGTASVLTTKEPGSDPTSGGTANSSLSGIIYKMRATRTSGGPLHVEAGEAGKAIIAAGVELARLMDLSKTPLPLEAVINDVQKVVYCGKQFEIQRDLTDTEFARDLEATMNKYGVGYVAVLRNGADSFVYITYGKLGPEYWASIHLPHTEVE